MPEFIDPRFRENKPKRAYSVIENERFGLVFAKTGSIISDTVDVLTRAYPVVPPSAHSNPAGRSL